MLLGEVVKHGVVPLLPEAALDDGQGGEGGAAPALLLGGRRYLGTGTPRYLDTGTQGHLDTKTPGHPNVLPPEPSQRKLHPWGPSPRTQGRPPLPPG